MAREKATHDELKGVAADIIRTQSAEIERMRMGEIDQFRGWLVRSVGGGSV